MTARGQSAAVADLAPAADDIDGRVVATIRMLAADAVETAGSGHPGLPMGAAPMAHVLWSRFLRHDPSRPGWPDRDRFVLSAGHGSMLLYALLHLYGYGLTLDDLRAFRQWGSRTPGHPEAGHTPGVETTTGPLGQGIANGVGMALAERMLAARYNRPGLDIVDHRTFVLASDGDLMEGITHEAVSLAGHLRLGRLVVFYDDNGISIDGPTGLAFSEDVPARLAACGWHTLSVENGNDQEQVADAVRRAVAEEERPTLIAVRTTIGFGAPTKAGTSDAHGAALGQDELDAAKARFGWPVGESFVVPDDVRAHLAGIGAVGRAAAEAWDRRFAAWSRIYPALAEDWTRTQAGGLPAGWSDALSVVVHPEKPTATRVTSGLALSALAAEIPELVGGSADLAGSTNIRIQGDDIGPGRYSGRNIHFGVREHAMGAVINGIALHRGLRPFASTFLVFSDYLRPALRLAALGKLGVVYVFTHDSIGLGEDGPTHQPVEHLGSLRLIPNLAVLRPADSHETAEAWRLALARAEVGPTALVLSRQAVPVLSRPAVEGGGWMAERGARVVGDVGDGLPAVAVAIVATGSEVGLAIEAARVLAAEHGVGARVVSMPWRERFCRLAPADQDALLPPGIPRLVVEAASPQGWEGVAGATGRVLGIERFGASAPGPRVMAELGFTPERIARTALEVIGKGASDAR